MEKEPSPDTGFNSARAWGYQELAICYFPHIKPQSATDQLSRWIQFSPLLQQRLALLGWRPGRKILTPRQVAAIVDHLGEP